TEKSRRIVDRAVSSRSAMALVQDFQPDVVGAAYDVGGYRSGVPECWVRPETVPVRRAISVCVNVTASGGIEASTLRKRGIAVASLVLALQSAGHPVTVDVAVCIDSYNGRGKFMDLCRVCDAMGSQVDIDRMVFAMAHP